MIMIKTESWASLFLLLLHVSLGFSDGAVKLRYQAAGDGIAEWRPAGSEGHALDRRTRLDGKPALKISRTSANQDSLTFDCRCVSEPIAVVSTEPYTVCALGQ